jgi:hypothetical protein
MFLSTDRSVRILNQKEKVLSKDEKYIAASTCHESQNVINPQQAIDKSTIIELAPTQLLVSMLLQKRHLTETSGS